jgi:NAD-dependent SIR2 family protein deacetylase
VAGNWDDYRLDEASFLNLHGQRAPRIMWLLGAGASVGAGLPTAYTLTWDLKRTLYCNTHRIPPARFPDLNDRDFQALVQSFLSERRGYPPAGCDEEYSTYFERVYPDEGDRRRYLESRLQGARPAYGHFCLAALVALGRAQIIWTTNFDPLIEEAIVQVQRDRPGQSKLAVVSLDCPDKLVDCLRDERWPVLVKLHGDYQYRALKNVKSELEEQDKTLRRRLVDQGGRRGLAVVGYSGRDVSVMQALEEVVDGSLDAFPHGLFWFTRPGALPGPRVLDLLRRPWAWLSGRPD